MQNNSSILNFRENSANNLIRNKNNNDFNENFLNRNGNKIIIEGNNNSNSKSDFDVNNQLKFQNQAETISIKNSPSSTKKNNAINKNSNNNNIITTNKNNDNHSKYGNTSNDILNNRNFKEIETHDKNFKIFDKKKIAKYWKDQQPLKYKITNPNFKFVDQYFPPNNDSLLSINPLTGLYNDPAYYSKRKKEFEEINSLKEDISWCRASEFLKDAKLFEGEIEIDDIKQGKLGNCYFLSAISSFAEFPEILKSTFKTEEINPFGYYEIVYFLNGEWQIVIVDDYVPIYKKQIPIGARPNGKEIWVMLLEKAFAKVNGGYTNMIAGQPKEVFNIFGFRSKTFKVNDYNIDILAEKLLSYNNKNCIMCCSSKGNKELLEKTKLKVSHAYSLIEAKEYIHTKKSKNKNSKSNNNDKIKSNNEINQNNEEEESERIFLLLLRNPWGKEEPDLDWNDKSNLWTSELKKYFGFADGSDLNKDMDDGKFFISLEDFFKYFNNIEISYPCHELNAKSINFAEQLKIDLDFPQLFYFEIFEKSKVHIVLEIPYWRYNREKYSQLKSDSNNINTQNIYYNLIKNPKFFILAKYYPESNKTVYMDYIANCTSEGLYLHNTLDKGIYLVYLYIGINNFNIKNIEGLMLTLKSTSYLHLKHIENDYGFNFLPQLISKKLEDKNQKVISKNNYTVYNDEFKDSGISYYSIINNSDFYYDTVLDISEIKEKFVILHPFYFNDIDGDENNLDTLEEKYANELEKRKKFIMYKNGDSQNKENFNQSFEKEIDAYRQKNSKNNFMFNNKNNFNVLDFENSQDSKKFNFNHEKVENLSVKSDFNFLICRTPPNTKILILFFLKTDNSKEGSLDDIKLINCQRFCLQNKFFKNKEEQIGPTELFNHISKEYNFPEKEYCIINGKDINQQESPLHINLDFIDVIKAFDPETYTYINNIFMKNQLEAKKNYLLKFKSILNGEKLHDILKDDLKSIFYMKPEKHTLNSLIEKGIKPLADIQYYKKMNCENQKNYDKLKAKFEKYMNLIDQIQPLENEDESKLFWKRIIKENHGVYIGTVNNYNIFHGRGFYFYEKNKNYSISNFYMGKRTGFCKIFNQEKDELIYEGMYKNDMKEGLGTFYFGNGEKYEGYFRKNKMEGKGKYISSDGTVLEEGIFKDNQLVQKKEFN